MMYLMFMLMGLGRSSGPSPQSQTATLQFLIPTRVGIYVGNDVTWDFGSIPTYPPVTFPEVYYPTAPASSPYMYVQYFTNTTGNWELVIKGSGDPGGGILIGDIEYSLSGAGSWVDLTTSNVRLTNGTGRTNGWEDYNLDWRVWMDGDEVEGTYSTTVTITMQTL